MAKYKTNGGARAFLKRNAAYLIMIACVLLTALIIIFASSAPKTNNETEIPDPGEISRPEPGDDEDTDPVVTEPADFLLPVSNAVLGYTYNLETPVTLSVTNKNGTPVWVIFQEVEFIAAEGTEVVAVYDGVVLSVERDIVDGKVVKIQHEDGLVSTYKYLKDDNVVKAGDTVKRGDVIGYIAVTYNMQYHIGAHLCFGLMKDGQFINPAEYLDLV